MSTALTVHVLRTLHPDETQPDAASDDVAVLSRARALLDYGEWHAPLSFRRSALSFAREVSFTLLFAT